MTGRIDPTSPADAGADTPCDNTVVECPLKHWFDLTFNLQLDKEPRKSWWPVERHPIPYPNEKVSIDLAGVTPLQKLDGNGNINITGIPSGSAKILFFNFYEDIHKQFKKGTKYAPR